MAPDTTKLSSLARAGLVFDMPSSFQNVTYFGRGEHDTYADRKSSGVVGFYETTPYRMYVNYPNPQSSGNRTDTRWASLTNEKGIGLLIGSDKTFDFSALPYSDQELETALHYNELPAISNATTVHIDAMQSGVGTATCGPGVRPQYLIKAEAISYQFQLIPVNKQMIADNWKMKK